MVFNVAVLHGGGVVPALDLDEAGLFDRLLIIALADIGMLQDIPREIFVDAGRVGLHGLLHVEHERQFLVFDLNGAYGLHSRNLILGDNSAHIIAIIAHMLVQQVPVGNILMRRGH